MPPKASTAGRASPRHHIVLVPGFAGFDALGQLEYYAGVTPQFRKWLARGGHSGTVLHYFDNFPTAAVATRARRLRNYLAKRILRGEFAPGDTLALVGHSTGGLDIRRLIWDLADEQSQHLWLDGARDPDFAPRKILHMIRRVVFLSVPQWGTNIADWVRAHALGRAVVVAKLRAAVESSQVPLLSRLQESVANLAVSMSGVDLLYAIQDALTEAEACSRRDRLETALAQEAASALALWLRHIATDFSAIDDLSVRAPGGDTTSPAHFDAQMRNREKQIWRSAGIRIQSYATLGKRPFRFDEDAAAPTWDLLNPCTYPECMKDQMLSAGTDIVYRAGYRACAGGPFKNPGPKAQRVPKPLAAPKTPKIAVWDNDGIVNTASMLWPDNGPILLVDADHMDIVGHYKRVAAPAGEGRSFEAYDLLKSDSGFTEGAFETVWNGVFDFCA
jgi:triacylglycerol esterase/lipase EstA (alpha/beta hydrolase family)